MPIIVYFILGSKPPRITRTVSNQQKIELANEGSFFVIHSVLHCITFVRPQWCIITYIANIVSVASAQLRKPVVSPLKLPPSMLSKVTLAKKPVSLPGCSKAEPTKGKKKHTRKLPTDDSDSDNSPKKLTDDKESATKPKRVRKQSSKVLKTMALETTNKCPIKPKKKDITTDESEMESVSLLKPVSGKKAKNRARKKVEQKVIPDCITDKIKDEIVDSDGW